MSLRTRLANFFLFIGVIALVIFALDVAAWKGVHVWEALGVGVAALAAAWVLGPGRKVNAPPPPAAPPAAKPKPAAAAPKGKPAPKKSEGAPPAAKPAAPPPKKKGLAGLFPAKPKKK